MRPIRRRSINCFARPYTQGSPLHRGIQVIGDLTHTSKTSWGLSARDASSFCPVTWMCCCVQSMSFVPSDDAMPHYWAPPRTLCRLSLQELKATGPNPISSRRNTRGCAADVRGCRRWKTERNRRCRVGRRCGGVNPVRAGGDSSQPVIAWSAS